MTAEVSCHHTEHLSIQFEKVFSCRANSLSNLVCSRLPLSWATYTLGPHNRLSEALESVVCCLIRVKLTALVAMGGKLRLDLLTILTCKYRLVFRIQSSLEVGSRCCFLC